MSCASGLTACELASIAATVEATFSGTATLQRPTKTDDGQGGQTVTWGDQGTYPCSLFLATPIPKGELVEGGKIVAVVLWSVQLPLGTDARVTDRVRVNGATYDILARDEGRSFAAMLTLTCRRLD